MKVVEKDIVVHGMLEDEYGRCREGKEYVYHYLVRRDGKEVINRHISEKELPELQKLIEEREKCRKEIRAYKKRMAYLEKLLNKPNPGGGRHESAA